MSTSLIETIEDFLDHDSAQVRSNACVALGAVGGASAERAAQRLMERALQDADGAVRAVACQELAALQPERKRAAIDHALQSRQQGQHQPWLQPALRALGPEALKGTPADARLGNGLAWRLALVEGMPTQARDWLRTGFGSLVVVALLAFFLAMLLAAWVEGSGGVLLDSSARLEWQLGAAAFGAALLWLQSRRQALLARYLGRVQGATVETLWSVAVALVVAGLFMLFWGGDEVKRTVQAAQDAKPAAPLWPALLLVAAMAAGMRWGSWLGALAPQGGMDRRLRLAVGVLAALGGAAVMAWAVLRQLPSGSLRDGAAGVWLPVFGAGLTALALVLAWREAMEGQAVAVPDRLRPVAVLAGGAGLVVLFWALMSMEQWVQTARKAGMPKDLTPVLKDGRWVHEEAVTRLPLRFVVLKPAAATGNKAQGKPDALKLKLQMKIDSAEMKTYEGLDPVLAVQSLASGAREKLFDDPESGCVDFDNEGRKLALRKLAGLASREGAGDPPVRKVRELVRTLLLRGAEVYERPLGTLHIELVEAAKLGDDKVCKERVESSGSADFEATATIQTPVGVIRQGAMVRLRKPSDTEEGPNWVSDMDAYNGKDVEVTTVDRTDTGYFRARAGDREWIWDKRWVTRIVPPAATATASSPAAAASR